MAYYRIEVTKCAKCGEFRVKYPRISLGGGKFSQGKDVWCECEREANRKRFQNYLETATQNLNAE